MKKIGELLVEQGKISERDVERTLLAQAEMGGVFGQVLVKLGLVSEADVAGALSSQLSVELLAAADYPESPIRLDAVAQDFLLSNAVVPVADSESETRFAATMPQDPFLGKALAMAVDREVLTEKITGVGELPAYGWVPPGTANYTPQVFDHGPSPLLVLKEGQGCPGDPLGGGFILEDFRDHLAAGDQIDKGHKGHAY